VPAQTFEGGVVRIAVVEGLEEVLLNVPEGLTYSVRRMNGPWLKAPLATSGKNNGIHQETFHLQEEA
jgi:hypothetical protein